MTGKFFLLVVKSGIGWKTGRVWSERRNQLRDQSTEESKQQENQIHIAKHIQSPRQLFFFSFIVNQNKQ